MCNERLIAWCLASLTRIFLWMLAEELGKYEVEGDALQSYGEFQLAATIYGALIEGAASEQSARMQAMENATKNAGRFFALAHQIVL